jgi:hypothetical protein
LAFPPGSVLGIYVYTYICMYHTYVCMDVCMYVQLYVCMYVRSTYVRTYVCVYVWYVYSYVHMWYVLIRPPIPYITSSRCKRLHEFRPVEIFLHHKRTNPRVTPCKPLKNYVFKIDDVKHFINFFKNKLLHDPPKKYVFFYLWYKTLHNYFEKKNTSKST